MLFLREASSESLLQENESPFSGLLAELLPTAHCTQKFQTFARFVTTIFTTRLKLIGGRVAHAGQEGLY